MSTLVTPSAKSHERVTGRWLRDIQANTRREWFAYYAKLVIGSPIPWLFSAYVCLNFISRAGLEIAAWGCALLTALYILVDRMSSNRELQFFRVGSDFFLLGYVVIGIITAQRRYFCVWRVHAWRRAMGFAFLLDHLLLGAFSRREPFVLFDDGNGELRLDLWTLAALHGSGHHSGGSAHHGTNSWPSFLRYSWIF